MVFGLAPIQSTGPLKSGMLLDVNSLIIPAIIPGFSIKNYDQIKPIFTDLLPILGNLKKQVELKNKDKKPKGKSK